MGGYFNLPMPRFDPHGSNSSTIPTDVTTLISSGSTTDVSQMADVSDKIVQDILRNVVPFQGDMSQIIQNRPHVMLPEPIRPHPAQMGQPSTNVQATTRAGQQRNDINSLIHGVGNIVKAGINKKREKDDRDLMADISLIQAASSNPDDPHNKSILDSIASDPKKVKRLQKALGYNPLSGEPMPPETQALVKGAKSIQDQKQQKAQKIQEAIVQRLGPQAGQMGTTLTGSPITQIPNATMGGHSPQPIPNAQVQPGSAMSNLMQRSPNMPQLNPVVAIQGELIKAGILPKADTSLKAMMDLTKSLITNEEKYNEVKMRADAYNNRTLQMYLKSVDDAKQKLELEKVRQQGATKRTNVRAKASTDSAKIRAGAEVQSAKIRAQSASERYKASHGEYQAKILDKAIKNLNDDIKNLDVQIAATKDAKTKQKLTEEQAAKKALKDALEQKEIGAAPESSNDNQDDQSILNELDDETPTNEDTIF